MKFIRILLPAIFGAALAGAALPAFAAAAVAVGDNNFSFTITEADSPAEARALAVKRCSEHVANCTPMVWTPDAEAIALAKSRNVTYGASHKDPAQARKTALALCRKDGDACEFAALYWEPGVRWAAWAYSETAAGALAASHFASGHASREQAEQAAMAGCEKQRIAYPDTSCKVVARSGAWSFVRVESDRYEAVNLNVDPALALAGAMASCRKGAKRPEACSVTQSIVNSGPVQKPKSFAAIQALSREAIDARAAATPAKPAAGSRTVNRLSCENRCVNGSCVRTFSDGRREKWQARRVFDPFSNDWKWDTSTNACGA